jgi:hypothetical protein
VEKGNYADFTGIDTDILAKKKATNKLSKIVHAPKDFVAKNPTLTRVVGEGAAIAGVEFALDKALRNGQLKGG